MAALKMESRFERDVDGEGRLDIMGRVRCGLTANWTHQSIDALVIGICGGVRIAWECLHDGA